MQSSKESRAPFYFLDHTINVLIADNDQPMVKLLTQAFGSVGLFSTIAVATTRRAVEIIEDGKRYHVCIFELGLNDMKGDEFYLLKKYHRHFPFIVLTKSSSAEKGFTVGVLGARALVAKSSDFDCVSFVRIVNRHTLLNIVNPRYRGNDDDPLSISTSVLFEKSPELATTWALEMGITDRELRHIWKKKLGANAKIILFIYHMYRRAFSWCENQIARQFDSAVMLGAEEEWFASDAYRRMEEYFHMHRSTILDYLAFGNVVNFLQ